MSRHRLGGSGMLRVAFAVGAAVRGAAVHDDVADVLSLVQTPSEHKAPASIANHAATAASFSLLKSETLELKKAKKELAALRRDFQQTTNAEANAANVQKKIAEQRRRGMDREAQRSTPQRYDAQADVGQKVKDGAANLIGKAGDDVKNALVEAARKAEEERAAEIEARLEAKLEANKQAAEERKRIKAERANAKAQARLKRVEEEHAKKMARIAAQAAKHQSVLERKADMERYKDISSSEVDEIKGEMQKRLDTEEEEAWNKAHFVRAEPGKECPEGWAPIMKKDACSRAHSVVGGVNDVDRLSLSWDNRPSGCFMHNINGHLNFNTELYHGALNVEDERICEKHTWGTEEEIAEQKVKVAVMEKKVNEDRSRQLAEEQATKERKALEEAAARFKKMQQDKYDDDHLWWKTYKVQVKDGVAPPGLAHVDSEDALAEKRRRDAQQGDEEAAMKAAGAALARVSRAPGGDAGAVAVTDVPQQAAAAPAGSADAAVGDKAAPTRNDLLKDFFDS